MTVDRITRARFACVTCVACACVTLLPCGCDRAEPSKPGVGVVAPAPSVAPSSSQAIPQAAAPPFTMTAAAIEALSADGTYIVRWEPVGGSLPDAEPFDMRFEVKRADGKPVARTAGVIVDAEMPQHGHGMNLTPTIARAGDGLYLARGMLLHMTGRWVLSIDIEEDAIAERTQWYVDVR
jgi:hypothetical protein